MKLIANVKDGFTETGIYHNDAMCQYEAWAVNQKTGETHQLGHMNYEAAKQWHGQAYGMWTQEVWHDFLREFGAFQ